MKPKNRIKGLLKPNFTLTPERDDKIQRQRDLESARLIWEKWKRKLLLRRRTIEDVTVLLNDLCADMEKSIKTPDLLENILRMQIEPVIAQMYSLSIMDRFNVELYVDCEHQVVTDKGMAVCGWGGKIMILKLAWIEKAFHLTCPQCGNQLGPDDCELKSKVDEQTEKGSCKGPKKE